MTTQAKVWGDFYFLERQSELLNEDGSRDILDPDLAAALIHNAGLDNNPKGLNAFLQELMPELGVGSMEEIPAVPLEELLEGIFG